MGFRIFIFSILLNSFGCGNHTDRLSMAETYETLSAPVSNQEQMPAEPSVTLWQSCKTPVISFLYRKLSDGTEEVALKLVVSEKSSVDMFRDFSPKNPRPLSFEFTLESKGYLVTTFAEDVTYITLNDERIECKHGT